MTICSKNIGEILRDPALRWYGAALSLANLVTALYWLWPGGPAEVLAPGTPTVCWPFIPACYAMRVLDSRAIVVLIAFLGALSAWTAGLFAQASTARPAYWLLMVLSATRAAIILQDYRLTLNHHYMFYCVLLPYLFCLGKRQLLPRMIVLMYFWAGVLKVTPGAEWLTGAAMFGRRPLGLPVSMLPAALLYVIVLELFISWSLLARSRWLFWTALFQVLLFHISSYWVVGFYYPATMFCLLVIFPLTRSFRSEMAEPGRLRVERLLPAGWFAIGVLCIAQLFRYTFPGESSITGEGRLFALNMFDTPIVCHATVRFKETADKVDSELRPAFVNTRLRCDPLVFFQLASDYCRLRGTDQWRGDIDLHLVSGRPGTQAQEIIGIRSFCAQGLVYNIWRHNLWLSVPTLPAG